MTKKDIIHLAIIVVFTLVAFMVSIVAEQYIKYDTQHYIEETKT